MEPYVGIPLSAADNQPLKVSRQVSTELTIDVKGVATKLACKFIVIKNMPENVDVILGMDNLNQTPYFVDLANRCLTTRQEVCLHSTEEVEIPPKSTCFVRCVTRLRKKKRTGRLSSS